MAVSRSEPLMRPPRLTLNMVLAATFALLAGPEVQAQDSPLSRQERARLRFQSLHESMQRLQVGLARSSPDESEILRGGNKFVLEARIGQRMEEIKELLEGSQWDEAIEEMGGVRDELGKLMNLLLNRDLDLKELLEEIEKLEAFKNRVEKLIGEQQREKENAARSEALREHLAQLERAKAEIERLIADQQQLREQADEAGLSASPANAEQMERREGALEDDANELAERMEGLEQAHEQFEDGDAATSEAEKGGAKSGEPNASDSTAGSSGGGACSGACRGAAGAMGKAEKKLGQNAPARSLEDMDEAMKKLEAAKKALAAMSDEATRELLVQPLEQQAAEQEVTRVDTDKLAEDMEKAGQGEQGQLGLETPGTQNVQQAVPKQKSAVGQLEERRPGKAKQNQQDAKEDLEEARNQLEEALAQLREQRQDEVLRALEERFEVMLAKQKELSARTKVTDRLRGEALTVDGSLPTALVERCTALSDGEADLASEAAAALRLLEEDATTAVFPEIVEELKGDLERVARRLDNQKTGSATQSMQAEIEDSLRMLIDALRRGIDDSEAGKSGQCDGEPPLVPMSAELKLVLALQKRVHERTKDYDTQVPEDMRASEAATTEAGEISRKQGRVKQLTRKLAVKVNQEAEAANQ